MKTSILVISLACIATAVFSQESRPRFKENLERIQVERVSYLTNKLDLTVQEAEKFWPLYNEYLQKREDLFMTRRNQMPRGFDPGQLPGQDLEKMFNSILDQEIKLAELKKEYYLKIREVIPVKKVLMLHRAEQDFMNHMLNQIRDGSQHPDGRDGRKEPAKTPTGNDLK
jgi:hypothetical protein